MPTLAIVGAGPGLGLAIARVFGREGFTVALIARRSDKVAGLAATLVEEGIEATGFTADVLDRPSLVNALAAAKDRYGPIDVLEYSPSTAQPAGASARPALDVTVENTQPFLDFQLHGAITATHAVLPDMLARQSGTLLYTTGASSAHPLSVLGNVGIAGAALRNWALALHPVLAKQGVYVGHVPIGVFIGYEGPNSEPDAIAAVYWEMHTTRTDPEHLYGPISPRLLNAE